MVHVNVAASAAAATASSNAILSRPRRLPSRGSFHAGEPFPQLALYESRSETGASSSGANRQRRRSTNAGTSGAAGVAGGGYGPIRRLSTHNRYHTFPTQPPQTPSEQPRPEPIYPPFGPASARPQRKHHPRHTVMDGSVGDGDDEDNGSNQTGSESPSSSHLSNRGLAAEGTQDATPLPWKQLALLALLSLAEQTALNSIGPYLPAMVGTFPTIRPGTEGLYVGLLASAFAMAQLTTNLFWGYLSDRIGRKPVMLLGTFLLGICFVFFGFCTEYGQLLGVHVAMGLLNGNAAVVPTCLGEVTDRTNQSRAFTWLPIMYSLGSITGPALGGLLVGFGAENKYPFLAPNLMAAGLLGVSVLVLGIWFEETLERDDNDQQESAGATLGRLGGWFARRWNRFLGRDKARRPVGDQEHPSDYDQDDAADDADEAPDANQTLLGSPGTRKNGDTKNNGVLDLSNSQHPAIRQLANRTTLAVLISYLVFQLSNISFNSLYPIFASASPPTGRNLDPSTIGISLSLAGLATIVFQGFLFQHLKARLGNLGTYRFSLLGMAISMAMMPWIGYLNEEKPWLGLGSGKSWLYSELGVILVLKNICAVGGLSSVMLLITNSAPSHETLGTLNGIAQTLSAAGRSVGPFFSGGLFTLSTRVQPKGEALAWGLFAGVSLAGWAGTLFIRGKGAGLESADWVGNDDEDEDEAGDEEAGPREGGGA